jgi:membrane protein implicated in regulation of membrane protease activity
MNGMLHSPGCFAYSSFIIPHSTFNSFLPPSAFILSLVVVSIVVVAAAAAVCLIAVVAAMSRHQKASGGELNLEGRVALVVQALEPEGAVLVGGELWRARARNGDRIARGRVRVVGERGHWLEVEALA